tara:strand:+ start:334 stop:675 length:342 start_codon:yes stop_codon:yes gene_type:complete
MAQFVPTLSQIFVHISEEYEKDEESLVDKLERSCILKYDFMDKFVSGKPPLSQLIIHINQEWEYLLSHLILKLISVDLNPKQRFLSNDEQVRLNEIRETEQYQAWCDDTDVYE